MSRLLRETLRLNGRIKGKLSLAPITMDGEFSTMDGESNKVINSLQHENAQLCVRLITLENKNHELETANKSLGVRVSDLEKTVQDRAEQFSVAMKQMQADMAALKTQCAKTVEPLKRSVEATPKPTPVPPAVPRAQSGGASVRSVHLKAPSLSDLDLLAENFRDQLTKILECKLIKAVSSNPVLSAEGYVADRDALHKHYNSSVVSPYSDSLCAPTMIDCPVLEEACRLLIQHSEKGGTASIVELYTKLDRLVPLRLTPEFAYVYVQNADGRLCNRTEARRQTSTPSLQLTDMCRLLAASARLSGVVM
jgi:hypothetical protein